MKIIEAIRTIQQKRMEERPVLMLRSETKHQGTSMDKPIKIVHVQTVMLQDDLFALRKKTCESSNKEAISKAIYHYLKCQETDEESS
ncbi:MAG: DUF5371 family protein [Candidatus Methanoperedens sp.]|nr:DUF5371 family protein [Candidatus Methanoperedens sp.]